MFLKSTSSKNTISLQITKLFKKYFSGILHLKYPIHQASISWSCFLQLEIVLCLSIISYIAGIMIEWKLFSLSKSADWVDWTLFRFQ